MPHKLYQCCDSNNCSCGRADKLYGNNDTISKPKVPKESQEFQMKNTVHLIQKALQSVESEILRLEEMRKELEESANNISREIGVLYNRRGEYEESIKQLEGKPNEQAPAKAKKAKR